MQKITLTLSIDDINMIGTALVQMPYIRVRHLVAEIERQAEAQLQAAKDAAE